MNRSFVIATLITALTLTAQGALADEPAVDAKPADATASKDAKKPEPATVVLHVASPSIVPIERDDTGELVCNSPCDLKVATGVRYRIGGAHPSQPFQLAPPSEGVNNVEVRPGMQGWFWGGVAGLGIGAGLLGVGIYVLAHGYANQAPVPGGDGETTDNSYTDAMALGTSLVLGGVVASIWGGATMISHSSTKVHGNVRAPAAPSTGAGAVVPRQIAAAAPSVSFPILAGTF